MEFDSYARSARLPLLRFAVVLTDDPDLAQDLVHDVLLRAQQQWPRISGVEHPHAYVRRMLANEVVTWKRKWGRVEPHPDEVLEQPAPDHAETVERRDALLREIARLPIKQRAAVVMRYLEDMTDDEIAAALECSAATVRVHIHRALRRLRIDIAPSARTAQA